VAKDFSLSAFVKELLTDMEGPELSWDFKLDAHVGYFMISIPIKLYGKSRVYLDDKVRRTAENWGLTVSTNRFKSDHDLVLEGTFLDLTGLAHKR
jgi:hypothetical protein